MRDAGEIEQSVETFALAPNGGLILIASHRELIIALAARYKLPPSITRAFSSPLED